MRLKQMVRGKPSFRNKFGKKNQGSPKTTKKRDRGCLKMGFPGGKTGFEKEKLLKGENLKMSSKGGGGGATIRRSIKGEKETKPQEKSQGSRGNRGEGKNFMGGP